MIHMVLAVVIAAVVLGFIRDEVRGWLELVPLGILWLVAMRLPADVRQAVYREEWRPELIQHLQEADGRPITRLVFGINYATSLAHGASRVGRELDGVREPEDVPRVYVSDADSGTAEEDMDVYRHIYAEPGVRHGGPSPGGITVTGEGGIRLGSVGLSATATMGGAERVDGPTDA